MTEHWWIPLAAYLLGSTPFGFLLVKLREGRDIRTAGSGNIGATNVARVLGMGAGALTLLFDAGKGYLAVALAARVTSDNITWMVGAALSAVLGHLFPVWLRFRGGRGVATGLGVFLPICWPAVLAATGVWVVVVLVWRYVSLASVIASAALPLLMYWLYAPGFAPPASLTAGTTLAAMLILWQHRPNIERLIAGQEARFKFRK